MYGDTVTRLTTLSDKKARQVPVAPVSLSFVLGCVGCWKLAVRCRCWMLDVGCRMLDVGCWMLDVGCWMLDVGCWMFDVGCSMLDVGSRTLVVEGWCWSSVLPVPSSPFPLIVFSRHIPHSALRIPNSGVHVIFRTPHCALRT